MALKLSDDLEALRRRLEAGEGLSREEGLFVFAKLDAAHKMLHDTSAALGGLKNAFVDIAAGYLEHLQDELALVKEAPDVG